MMIKTRLTISNIIMFIVPMLLIVIITATVFDTLTETYKQQLLGFQKEFFNGSTRVLTQGLETMLLNMKSMLISSLALIILASILIICILNSFLAARFTKSILEPLNLLRYGSKQIKEGNLDFELNYNGHDEFGQVCRDFDEMRLRLKDSIDLQLKYESDKKDLVAGFSHDLRTPLTVIKGYVEGLRDGVANTPEKQKNYLDIIYRKACDMDSLVDNLFLFSKMDTDHYPFHFMRTNLCDYFSMYFAQAKQEFSLKGLELDFEDYCNPNTFMQLDREEMGRVLMNIIQNSAKHKTKEIVKVQASINQVSNEAIITIKDDGPGVDEENLSKLFTRFYREDPSRSNAHEGSGLGLAIAKHIVNAHGGTITAQNNNGLEVIISLPIECEGAI